jgi:hypothetical protein
MLFLWTQALIDSQTLAGHEIDGGWLPLIPDFSLAVFIFKGNLKLEYLDPTVINSLICS